MKFEKTDVWGFDHAIRGMRNPKNSWALSDSFFGIIDTEYDSHDFDIAEAYLINDGTIQKDWRDKFDLDAKAYMAIEDKIWEKAVWVRENGVSLLTADDKAVVDYIGPKDLKLMQTLIRSGPEHRKFMRQIFVSVDITAPLYWWKEFDTYKVGTVANSTSTMHKLASAPITKDCFEMDDYDSTVKLYDLEPWNEDEYIDDAWQDLINACETLRCRYNTTKEKKYWKELVRILPSSWLQKRTVTMNYENLLAICSKSQRRFHKLNEWSGQDMPSCDNFINWARKLPYAQELLFIDEVSE